LDLNAADFKAGTHIERIYDLYWSFKMLLLLLLLLLLLPSKERAFVSCSLTFLESLDYSAVDNCACARALLLLLPLLQ
jgi:hypothetical protein